MGKQRNRRIVLSPEEEARFWGYVQRGEPSECWLWTGSCKRGSLGYGAFNLSKNNPTAKPMQAAHKVSLVISGRHLPAGRVILHLCDNPKCVNPGHLKVGTQKHNVRDMCKKGRHRGGFTKKTTEQADNGNETPPRVHS